MCPRYEEVANFYCGVYKGWGRVTQKVRRSGVLSANPHRALENLDIHGTNGYSQKAQKSSRNRNVVYRFGASETRKETPLQKAGRERNGERDKENETVGKLGCRCLLRRIQRRT